MKKKKMTYKKYFKNMIFSIILDTLWIVNPFTGLFFKKINIIVWLMIIACSATVIFFYLRAANKAEKKMEFWLKYDFIFEIANICLMVSIINAFIILSIINES